MVEEDQKNEEELIKQEDNLEKEEMYMPPPPKGEAEEEEGYQIELEDGNRKGERKSRKEEEEELKGNLPAREVKKAIPARYRSDSNESITFSNHIIVE